MFSNSLRQAQTDLLSHPFEKKLRSEESYVKILRFALLRMTNKEIDKEDTFSLFYVSIENFESKEILKKELETLNL